MKLVYGIRSSMYYPFRGGEGGRHLPPPELREEYLGKIREMDFDGVELSVESLGGLDAGKDRILELRKELEDAGLPCLAVRTKGGLHEPEIADKNRAFLHKGVQIAGWIGAGIVDATVTTIPKEKRSGFGQGEAGSEGSSRDAGDREYEITAGGIAEAADVAADLGVGISIEVHHSSIVDNSSSAIRMLELVDRPNVGVNPDVKNMVWAYDIPEEPWEEMMLALAPHSNYWHCKNIKRIHIPQLNYSVFLRVPLPDGDINYHFALAAMVKAGYKGCLTIEGVQEGDQLYKDGVSAAYARKLIHELDGKAR